MLPDLVGKLHALVKNLVGATQHEVHQARGILKELVGEQIVLHPAADGVERYLTAELAGDYAGLVRLVRGQNNGGGGQASSPSLTDPWGVDIQGVALVA